MKTVISEETAQIVRYLREFPKETAIGYAELSRNVGFVVSSTDPKLTSARRILQRDHSQIWVCRRPRVALVRLGDTEIAERLPGFWLRGARSKLKRGGKQATVVEVERLDIDERAAFAVNCLQQELAFNSLSRGARNKLTKIARGTSNDLPTFTAVEWAFNLTRR